MALHQRDRDLALLAGEGDRLGVHLVAHLLLRRLVVIVVVGEGDREVVVGGLLFADEGGELFDLLVGEKSAVDPLHLPHPGRQKEHVAIAQQRLGTVGVDDRARVGLRGDLEGDARRKVRLDHPGEDVHRRPLGGDHQMDAGGARHLREAGDGDLHVAARHHHEVRQLVDDHHHVRQGREGRLSLHRLGEGVVVLHLRHHPVEAGKVPDPVGGEQGVAPLHLLHRPVERHRRLLRVGDHRRDQVRDPLVDEELEHLRVDHQKLHLVRPGAEQDRGDDRVDAHRLARAGGAGNQQMRHPRQVADHRVAEDVLAQGDGDLVLARVPLLRADHLAEEDAVALDVRHLDPHRPLARDRRDDADGDRAQGHGEVVGEVGDLGDLDPRRRLELVHGDHRPRVDLGDLTRDAKVEELVLEDLRVHQDLPLGELAGRDGPVGKQGEGRKLVVIAAGKLQDLLGGQHLHLQVCQLGEARRGARLPLLDLAGERRDPLAPDPPLHQPLLGDRGQRPPVAPASRQQANERQPTHHHQGQHRHGERHHVAAEGAEGDGDRSSPHLADQPRRLGLALPGDSHVQEGGHRQEEGERRRRVGGGAPAVQVVAAQPVHRRHQQPDGEEIAGAAEPLHHRPGGVRPHHPHHVAHPLRRRHPEGGVGGRVGEERRQQQQKEAEEEDRHRLVQPARWA